MVMFNSEEASHSPLQPSHSPLQPSHSPLQPSHSPLQPSHSPLQPLSSSPRRRALLPRNPIPWSPPLAAGGDVVDAPPASVQELLQQVGHGSYQPFQSVGPLLPPHTPSLSASSLPSPTPKKTNPSPLSLVELCRCQLVSHWGLRCLTHLLQVTQVPKCVMKFLTSFSASECIVRHSAPLLDVLAAPFYHRAVTWRVTCAIDGAPYLATYSHTAPPQDYPCLEEDEESPWLRVYHPHIMRIWGTVLDHPTGNSFYLLDVPIASLHQIQNQLSLTSTPMPESLVWCVLLSVSSAILHCNTQGLQYNALHLTNILITPQAVVLENDLTRKKRVDTCDCSSKPNSVSSHTTDSCTVRSVGLIVLALVSCHLKDTHRPSRGSVAVCTSQFFRRLRRQYSSTLLHFLSRSLRIRHGTVSTQLLSNPNDTLSEVSSISRKKLDDPKERNLMLEPEQSCDVGIPDTQQHPSSSLNDHQHDRLVIRKDEDVKPKMRLTKKKKKVRDRTMSNGGNSRKYVRHSSINSGIKENLSPNIQSGDYYENIQLTETNFSKRIVEEPLTVKQMTALAQEQVLLRFKGRSVEEALKSCPEQLVQLVLAQQR